MSRNFVATKHNYDSVFPLYISGQSLKKTSKLTGIPYTTLHNSLKRNNFLRKGPYRKYNFDDTFFEKIDTQPKAYFLGLLTADGCINNNYNVRLTLHSKDEELLDKFKFYTKSDTPIQKNNFKEAKSFNLYGLKVVKDLQKFGIVPNKTFKTYFPDIPIDMYSHFIRGVFDGDGYIYNGKRTRGDCKFNIIGTESLLNSIKEIINNNCNLNKKRLYPKISYTGSISYSLDYYGSNLLSIFNFLYKDSICHLERKFNTFKLVCTRFNNDSN